MKLYKGFSFKDIETFENTIIEVIETCNNEYNLTRNDDLLSTVIDCLNTINKMEKIKLMFPIH